MFEERRAALFQSMPASSAVVIKSAPIVFRNADAEYPYRQQSDFYYLTGITQPNVYALFIKSEEQTRFLIACEPRAPAQERWHGPRMGLEEAQSEFGADHVLPITALDEQVPNLLSSLNQIYFVQSDQILQQQLTQWQQCNRKGPVQSRHELHALLAPLRMQKDATEIACIKKAIAISEQGHLQAMAACKTARHEYELEAALLSAFYAGGSRSPAYPSIVASGANACILHYTENQALLGEHDLVLIDAGAEYGSYAADITRTFPVSGRFTKPQAALYELVLAAQLKGLSVVKAGVPFDQIQKVIVEVLADGLHQLGILPQSPAEIIDSQAYRKYYMHNSGHWLGLDVHDVGPYHEGKQSIPMPLNQVLTIEPGLYFDPTFEEVPAAYRGIGIRIEDDVLVGATAGDVLSSGVPKTIPEIEALMSHGRQI